MPEQLDSSSALKDITLPSLSRIGEVAKEGASTVAHTVAPDFYRWLETAKAKRAAEPPPTAPSTFGDYVGAIVGGRPLIAEAYPAQAVSEPKAPAPKATTPTAPTGRAATLAAVREKYPQYADMTDDALAGALAAKYPVYADLVQKAPERSTIGKIGQIAKEGLGRVPSRVREEVKGIVEGIRDPKMSTVLPLTLGPGAGVVSRVGSVAMGRMMD